MKWTINSVIFYMLHIIKHVINHDTGNIIVAKILGMIWFHFFR